MSGADPRSPEYLRKLARDAREGKLSKNDEWELQRARSASGPLSRELDRIMKGGS